MRRFKPILSLLIAAAAGLAQAQYSAPLANVALGTGATDAYPGDAGAAVSNLAVGATRYSGWGELVIDSMGGWGGYQTGVGSTTNNAAVVVGYSTPNATNNANSGWAFFSSAVNVIQDKYAYARLRISPLATNWGTTAIVFRVRTSGTGADTNKVSLLLTDGATAYETGLTNLVSTTAGAWLDVPVLAADLPAGWQNLAAIRPALTLRGDYFVWQSNYVQWVEAICFWQ